MTVGFFGMQTHTLDGHFLRLSSWPLRDDAPTLVMLHGSGGTGVLWEAQVSGLGDVANVVAVDLAGHGRSERPLPGSISEHAADIARLVAALGGSRTLVCGSSLGGGIALQMLLDHADLVAGGVLLGTGARLRVMPAILQMIERDFDGFVRGMPRGAASPSTDPALVQPLLHAMRTNGSEVVSADFMLCDAFDVMARLHEIERPVLVVSGEHDSLTPPKYARYLAEHITGARLVVMRNAGHLAPMERPDAVNDAIRTWILDVGASVPRDVH